MNALVSMLSALKNFYGSVKARTKAVMAKRALKKDDAAAQAAAAQPAADTSKRKD